MPEIDDLLAEAAGRWRDAVDARYATAQLTLAPQQNRSRRTVLWTTSLAGAAVVVGGVVIATLPSDHVASRVGRGDHHVNNTDGAGSEASCVAPFLRADRRVSPPEPGHPTTLGDVRGGQRVTVYGNWYFGGLCEDTGSTITPRAPAGSVRLLLTTSDHDTTTLATVQPGSDASFTATVTIPSTAVAGPANITDGRGHVVDLVILTS